MNDNRFTEHDWDDLAESAFKHLLKKIAINYFQYNISTDVLDMHTGWEYDMANIVVSRHPKKILDKFRKNLPYSKFDINIYDQKSYLKFSLVPLDMFKYKSMLKTHYLNTLKNLKKDRDEKIRDINMYYDTQINEYEKKLNAYN